MTITNSKFLNSEYNKILSVLLHKPIPKIEKVLDPKQVMHNDFIKFSEINEEFNNIIHTFEKLGIYVQLIDFDDNSEDDISYFNLMFARDLLFMIPEGAIIANMKYPVRKKEPIVVEKTLNTLGIPIIGKVVSEGTFEGADALWVNPELVLIGVGNRTNEEGFLQVQFMLEKFNIKCIKVEVPKSVQHLLGVLQFVDHDLVLLRQELVSDRITEVLQRNHVRIISIPEIDEVVNKQAMNIVTVAPRTIIMPDDCPTIQKTYQENDLTIIPVKIKELRKGAGGLGCATSIISRTSLSCINVI